MAHICVGKLIHRWFRQWLVVWAAPSHNLNQWWNIVYWTLGNELQWNLNRNSQFSFTNMHMKMSSGKLRPFLSRPQYVNAGTYIVWSMTRFGLKVAMIGLIAETLWQMVCMCLNDYRDAGISDQLLRKEIIEVILTWFDWAQSMDLEISPIVPCKMQ